MLSFIEKFIGKPANDDIVYVVQNAKTGHYKVNVETANCNYQDDLVYSTKSCNSAVLADQICEELSVYKLPDSTNEFKCTEQELLAALTHVIATKDHEYYRGKIREMKAFIESDECKAFMTGKSILDVESTLYELINKDWFQFDEPSIRFISISSLNAQFRAMLAKEKLSLPTDGKIVEMLKAHANVSQHFYINDGIAIPGYIIKA